MARPANAGNGHTLLACTFAALALNEIRDNKTIAERCGLKLDFGGATFIRGLPVVP